MPNITFSLATASGTVDLNLSPYSYAVAYNGRSDACFLGILESNDTMFVNSVLLGNIFLKNYYTVFDYGAGNVGFAAVPAESVKASTGIKKKAVLVLAMFMIVGMI